MNIQTSKLSPRPTYSCLFLLFSCVLLWEVSMTVFSPLTHCGFFCNTSEGFKKQISGFIQRLSVVDGTRHRLCILKGMLIKLPSHSDEDESFKWTDRFEKNVNNHFLFSILIRSGHNLWNPSFQILARYIYVCFNMISDAFHHQKF